MCMGCVQRERRASERKKQGLAGRRSPEESNFAVEQEQHKIVQFHSNPVIDFSTGEAIVSMRITWFGT